MRLCTCYDNGQLSEETAEVTERDAIESLEEKFRRFVEQLSSPMPHMTEFHCRVIEDAVKIDDWSARTEDPEEILLAEAKDFVPMEA